MKYGSRSAKIFCGSLAVCASIAVIVPLYVWRLRDFARSAEPQNSVEFRPVQVVPAQPAIRNAAFIAAHDVNGQVDDAELVIGVVVNGQAAATRWHYVVRRNLANVSS